MFKIMVIVQMVVILGFVGEMAYVLKKRPSREQQALLMCTVLEMINSIGYLFEITTNNMESALIAVKFAYIGKVFISLVFFVLTGYYCGVKISHRLLVTLAGVHGMILATVFTCERHTLYYSSIAYERSGIFPHLVLGHGPLYWVQMLSSLVYFVVISIMCRKCRLEAENKKEKIQMVIFPLVMLLPEMMLLLFILRMTGGYDPTSVGYVISTTMLIILTFRDKVLDTVEVAKNDVLENMSEGIVVLGENNEILYTNSLAKQLFPGFKSEEHEKEAAALVMNMVGDHYERLWNDHYYKVSQEEVAANDFNKGTLLKIQDVTDYYRSTNELKSQVKRKTEQVTMIQQKVIAGFADVISVRDDATGEHVKRTSYYVGLLARDLQKNSKYNQSLTDELVNDIVDAAPLHDIGKIAIPDSVLNKPGKLTPEEYEIIKTHSEIGGKMIEKVLNGVESSRYLTVARDIAYYHHERWDGKGYPQQLKGEEIPIAARIMAVCDVYDALVSKRCYKDSMSTDEAYKIICDGSGTQFDPVVVASFCREFEKIRSWKGNE